MTIGKKFPKITVQALSGKEVTLPDDVKREVALIGIAFVRGAQGMLDSWSIPFERACSGESVYELPMIDGFFWKIFSGMIDSGMRAGIPGEKHDNVLTHYGDTSAYRETLSMDDKRLGYVFLIDKEGIIRFEGKGYAHKKDIEEMLRIAGQRCQEKKEY
jgi:hypothetical protein